MSSISIEKTQSEPIVWSVAASDSGGGAGIQADLKTFFDLNTYGCTLLTAVTAQNTQGVQAVFPLPIDQVVAQCESLVTDLKPSVIKVGVLPTVEIARYIFTALANFTLIVDPVLAPTSGRALIEPEVIGVLKQHLSAIDLITPNRREAEQLTGIRITDSQSQECAAGKLIEMGVKAVLLKGGHNQDSALCQDFFIDEQDSFWLTQTRYHHHHSHGTGCTLASAIAAYLARGKSLRDSVVLANAYVNYGLFNAGRVWQDRLSAQIVSSEGVSSESKGAVCQSGTVKEFQFFPEVSLSAEAIKQTPFPSCEALSLGLYPVVDSIEWLEKLLPLSVPTIQLRIKDQSGEQLESTIKQAVALSRQYTTRLFINDYWQLAIKYGAYGVHLGQEDLQSADTEAIKQAGLRLGVSTHSEYEWCYGATFKPSYIALGAVFPTDTKEVVEIGLDNLSAWATILKNEFPLVAIGGIGLHNIEPVLATGVGSVAVVSAVTRASHYSHAVSQLLDFFDAPISVS